MEFCKHVAIIGMSGVALSGAVALVSEGYCEDSSVDSCPGMEFARDAIYGLRFNIYSAIVIDRVVSRWSFVKDSLPIQNFLRVCPLYLQLAAAAYVYNTKK